MSSLFDDALQKIDSVIGRTMMNEWFINGKPFNAVYDEAARVFEGLHTEDTLMNGTARTLTLFKASGYKPRINDQVERNGKVFFVKSYYYEDDLLIVRLE